MNNHSSSNGELNHVKARLRPLEAEKQALLKRKQELESLHITPILPDTFTNAEKIQIFQNLFIGRPDVYAVRWESSSTGKSGYSVACANEWQSGLCHKPKVRCHDCQHRAYEALDGQTILRHLTGKQIIGLYPLLANNSCRFLAIDFDKADWQPAALAFAQMCKHHDIPYFQFMYSLKNLCSIS